MSPARIRADAYGFFWAQLGLASNAVVYLVAGYPAWVVGGWLGAMIVTWAAYRKWHA